MGTPLPGKPWLSGARERVRVGVGKFAGREDGFAVADVPSRIGITKQLLIALKQKQAVEEGDSSGHQRHIRRQPRQPAYGRTVQTRYAAGALMLDKSPVMLWYRLTMPADNCWTVEINARPTAATIRAYSTRSCPCSSRTN